MSEANKTAAFLDNLFGTPSRYVLIAFIVVCFFLIRTCNRASVAERNYEVAVDSTKFYKTKSGALVASQRQLSLSNSQLKQELKKQKELAEIAKTFSKVEGTVQAKVKYVKTVVVAHDSIPNQTEEMVLMPVSDQCYFTGKYTDKWAEIKYEVTNDSAYFKYQTWTGMNEVYGYKKKWLLGRAEPTVDISFTNPDMTIIEVKTIKTNYKVPFYDTRTFNLAVGFAAGILINKL